jgi:hypothetical protein
MDKMADKGAKVRRACIDSADVALVFVDGHDDAILGVAERDGEVCVATIRPKLSKHCEGAMTWTKGAPPNSSNTRSLEVGSAPRHRIL